MRSLSVTYGDCPERYEKAYDSIICLSYLLGDQRISRTSKEILESECKFRNNWLKFSREMCCLDQQTT